MGVIELDSFCCGCLDLERGCKVISLVTLSYSSLLFALSVSQDDLKEAHAAFLLLALTVILLYGVIEKIKMMVMLYLLLRAVALVLVLAEIMRNLAGMKRYNEERFMVILLETVDCVMTLYFWLVVYSFCLRMDDASPAPPDHVLYPPHTMHNDPRLDYAHHHRKYDVQPLLPQRSASLCHASRVSPPGGGQLSPPPTAGLPMRSASLRSAGSPMRSAAAGPPMHVQKNPFLDE